MNQEPVAWMQTWENQDGELKHTVNIEQIGKNDIPLYTHPHPDNLGLALSIIDQQKLEIERLKAKTLTDEEINELAENTLPNQAIGFVPSWQWIEFARAILRKAQEK